MHYYAAVLVGRVTGLIRPSVRLSFPYGLLSQKRKDSEKPKLMLTFPVCSVGQLLLILLK